MSLYTWLPLTTALQQIQDRLNAAALWVNAELEIYLQESLSLLNGLTEWSRAEFTFNTQGSQWIDFGTLANSPRLRSVTDASLCTQMEYMLMEPPVGIGTWTGTTQFDTEKLQSALQVRANEVIQAAGCNMATLELAATPGIRRTQVPDTTLEIRRVRFLQVVASPKGTCALGATTVTLTSTAQLYVGLIIQGVGISAGTVVTSLGNGAVGISLPTAAALSAASLTFLEAYYLKRSDTQAFQDFNSDYITETGTPCQWSVAAEPPLAFDTDVAPELPGQLDLIVLQSQAVFATSPTIIAIPNDWCWGPLYGAIADLLNESPEATDRQRAAYCAKRYQDFLKMFGKSNWFLQALINGAVADTPSLKKKDQWSIGWQEDLGSIPCVITDGIDQLNVAPPNASSVLMTVIQNAPYLDPTNTYVQVTRDDWNQCLNYITHIAMFKVGGAEFSATVPMLDEFLAYCVRKNRRQSTYGFYTDVLNSAGQKQTTEEPR